MIKNFIQHLISMGNLEGKATDYPIPFIFYLGAFIACSITTIMLYFSKYGKRVVWLPDQSNVIKSRFSYMAMLACTFTGVFLVGSFPAELQNTYGTWNADLFYTFGQTSIMIIVGIYSLATYKSKKSTVLNILSIIIGLTTSIPMAATTILSPLNLEGALRWISIIVVIAVIAVLALVSVKFDLLVKYSRINIYMFIITSIALFTTICTYDNSMVDTSKILPFQGMINAEPWMEWLTNPYWWYFESSVVAWSIFCGRFVAYCSNGYTVKEVIKYGTLSLVILTVIWHLVSAATGYTLGFSRGLIVYILTACTMLAFAVTSLDSATKTLINDVTRLVNEDSLKNSSKKINQKKIVDVITYGTIGTLGVLNIILLMTGFPRVFTIIFGFIFVPYFVRVVTYTFKFGIGKIDFSKSGTISKEEYEKIHKLNDMSVTQAENNND